MFTPSPLPRTLEASLRDLSSEKPATRASAVKDLARHAQADEATRAKAVPLFEKALSDAHPGVRGAAAIALADVRGAEALPALLTAVEDADGWVRQMALSALGEIGDTRAAARLARALGDSRHEVRYQAVIAFARVAPAEDVAPALLRATRDDDPAIRYIALRIAEERAETFGGVEMRARAAELLADDTHQVRLAAAIYLAKAGDPSDRARALLFEVIAGRASPAPEAEDEQEAVELAGALGMKDAVPYLEKRAWGLARLVKHTCAWQARVALARMGHPRAKAEILQDLASSKREERTAAVVAAGRARIKEARPRIEALGAGDADPELVKDALALLA